MNLFKSILNIIFPINCISCGKKGSNLCIKCLSESPLAIRECEDWIYPLFDYRYKPIKKSLWLLKYKDKKAIAETFAKIMYEKIIEELADLSIMENFREPIMIPIPLSPKRYRERGYNQAELICKELIKIDEKQKVAHIRHGVYEQLNFSLKKNILIKIKETEHQARIKERRDRLKNLSDSFAVKNPELIKNRNIILIDDITTTGTTLNEAKKILKKNGAKKIIAFTVAH